MKKLITIICIIFYLGPSVALAGNPSVLDTIPLTSSSSNVVEGVGTGTSFSYTVPAGSNTMLLMLCSIGDQKISTISGTINGDPLTFVDLASASINVAYQIFGYRVAPTSGTFTVSWTGSNGFACNVTTIGDVTQTSPIDAYIGSTGNPTTTFTTDITTNVGNDLIMAYTTVSGNETVTEGSGQTVIITAFYDAANTGTTLSESSKGAASSPGVESMTVDIPTTGSLEHGLVAIKYEAPAPTGPPPPNMMKINNGGIRINNGGLIVE